MARSEHTEISGDGTCNSSVVDFAAEVRLQLHRILRSSLFVKSPQAANLLSFLVDQTLSTGSSQRPKEYAIAIQVLGRSTKFDPTEDNIVRVEVRRTRAKLERYYKEEGASDTIVISIPKGAYVPVFRIREEGESDLSGRTISHYELVRRKCSSRLQETYEAKCLNLHRGVTVILPTRSALEDQSKRSDLLSGVQSGLVDHPSVSAIHDVEATDARIIIALGQMPGEPLRQYVTQEEITSLQMAVFAQGLAIAIASGHKSGAVHGILCPDLVNVAKEVSRESLLQPHILPFGLSGLVVIEQKEFDGFRPPEWIEGFRPDLRSDVWSFGALVWFAAHNGAKPPQSPQASLGDFVTTEPDAMPPQLAEIVSRCLQTDPLRRYANVLEVLHELSVPSSAPYSSAPEKQLSPPAPATDRRALLEMTALLSAVLLLTIFATIRFRNTTTAEFPPRMIVLPLENVGGDPETQSYCRAVSERLGAILTKEPSIQLVGSRYLDSLSRNQFSTYFLRQKLRINYVVEGTLLKSDSRFQATLRLVDATDGSYAWSGSLGGSWSTVSEDLDRFVEKAGIAIESAAQTEKANSSAEPPINAAAYEVWLEGRIAATEYWNSSRQELFDEAERRLKRAMELQPNYVDAIVDLGQLYLSAAYPARGNQAEMLQKAANLAAKALAVNPQSGPAHALRGSVYTDTGNTLLGLPHLYRAQQLIPDDPIPRNYLAIAYETLGFWEEALSEREKAAQRDPLLKGIRAGSAILLAKLGRHSEAFEAANSLDPGTTTWNLMMARLYIASGQPGRAEAILTPAKEREPASLAKTYESLITLARALQGHPEIAKQMIGKLVSNERSRSDSFVSL
ncbi:MAG TPA: protein kinase, partial [Bryobacteraceae bacterium]|nr:protein kinase [Bryobacteraceae bacterium]